MYPRLGGRLLVAALMLESIGYATAPEPSSGGTVVRSPPLRNSREERERIERSKFHAKVREKKRMWRP